MLPGQNFIGFGTRTYRPHDYTGWAPRRHLRATSTSSTSPAQGRVWSGLTKAMTPEHARALRRRRLTRPSSSVSPPTPTTTIDHWQNFATAFARAPDGPTSTPTASSGSSASTWCWSPTTTPTSSTARRSSTSPRRSTSGSRTSASARSGTASARSASGSPTCWSCGRWARRHPEHYLSVNVREFEADPDAVRAKLVAFLALTTESGDLPDGFVAVLVEGGRRDPGDRRRPHARSTRAGPSSTSR